jgi:MoaA/NifB/PqqE/SkfB family radical SAM enzyme
MRLFDYWKRKLNKKLPVIGFNTVITSENYRKLPEMVSLLHSLGGSMMNVQTIILYSPLEKKWTLSERQNKELPKYLRKAIRIADKYNITTNLREYLNRQLVDKSTKMDEIHEIIAPADAEVNTFNEDACSQSATKINDFIRIPCYEPWYLMTIRANGIVGSCRLFRDDGDSIHDKTLSEVWFGDYFTRARARLAAGTLPEYCSKCGSNELVENRRLRRALTDYMLMQINTQT